MLLIIILLIFNIIKCKSSENLIFSDEFNGNTLDFDKWEVQNEQEHCDGSYIRQLNCKVNSTRNLRLINGTLVIAAIEEKHANKDFTSALITTQPAFTCGRFEIRAALPVGKLLRPAIFLQPKVWGSGEWFESGQIDLMANVQNDFLKHGIHFAQNGKYAYAGGMPFIKKQLNNFHTYILEWTPSEFVWILDDTVLTRKSSPNISDNPFEKPFKLKLTLGIGGQTDEPFFNKNYLTDEEVSGWNCSLFILDYVRIYQNSVGGNNGTKDELLSSTNICQNIMPSLRLKTEAKTQASANGLPITAIISISSFLLIILIIPLIAVIFIRMKRTERTVHRVNELNQYVTDGHKPEMYDDINPNTNIYTDPYYELNEYTEYNEIEPKYLQITE